MSEDNFITPVPKYEESLKLVNVEKCTLDVCADFNNSKCAVFFDKKTDALRKDCNWLAFDNKQTVVWCNPPHSKTKLFVEKAYEQFKKFGTTIVMLIPLNCLSSNYAFKYIHGVAEIKFLQGRINFIDPTTLKPSKFPSRNGYIVLKYKAFPNDFIV